jgi:hypothetical protein
MPHSPCRYGLSNFKTRKDMDCCSLTYYFSFAQSLKLRCSLVLYIDNALVINCVSTLPFELHKYFGKTKLLN